jgi:predicted nucleic acid-binding protein
VGLIKELGSGPVCLDSVIFIYFIEENQRFLEAISPLFMAIAEGRMRALTSGISLLETLVVPMRVQNVQLAKQYAKLMLESPGLTLLELNLSLLYQAAAIRAKWGIKTPDALQLAAAVIGNCSTFLTNDRRLPSCVEGVKVMQLGDFVPI